MGKALKLYNNVVSSRAAQVLGPAVYARYLMTAIRCLPDVIRFGNLSPLDRAMGRYARDFTCSGSRFTFDCAFADEELDEESYGFGIVREIYIRDCYFKWHPEWVFNEARTVVDLGANRGAFSALMTTRAQRLVLVECSAEYVPVIEHNMAANRFTDFAIETVMIGSGGEATSTGPTIGMQELFDKHDIKQVDMLKMDIEGSEFSLFKAPHWLDRVTALSMEIHGEFGDSSLLPRILADSGFTYVLADDDLRRVVDPARATLVFAHRVRSAEGRPV